MLNKKMIPVLIPGTGVGLSAIHYANKDPLGSYTGVPIDSEDIPVQDADDL